MALLAVLAVVLVLVACTLAGHPWQRVGRTRLDKFARRQSLPITVENGPLVIRYLSATRRWRGGGLLLGLLTAICWPLATASQWPPDKVNISFLSLFAGWFAGAVIAEWRVSSIAREPGPRRSAALEPRRLADYLPRSSGALPALAWAIVVAAELAGLVSQATHSARGSVIALVWLVFTVLTGAVLLAVGRQVLVRPQRCNEPGLIVTDDALRSRSLHVLAGSALAIAGYLLASFVHALTPYSSVLSDGVASALGALGYLAAPIFGYLVATAAAAPIRRARRTAVLDATP